MEGTGKSQCELTRQRGWERECSGQREEHLQRLGGKLALWRTRRKGKVAGGCYARGRGLVEARKEGAPSDRASDLMLPKGATGGVYREVTSPTCSSQ